MLSDIIKNFDKNFLRTAQQYKHCRATQLRNFTLLLCQTVAKKVNTVVSSLDKISRLGFIKQLHSYNVNVQTSKWSKKSCKLMRFGDES